MSLKILFYISPVIFSDGSVNRASTPSTDLNNSVKGLTSWHSCMWCFIVFCSLSCGVNRDASVNHTYTPSTDLNNSGTEKQSWAKFLGTYEQAPR